MERNSPVRKSHTSTADLLTWSETPPPETSAPDSRTSIRMHQPAGGVSKVLIGGLVTDEEAQSFLKRKPCSGPKLKDMTGSGIFAADSENGGLESSGAMSTPNNKTSVRTYQQAASGISQISFSVDDSVSPKKPTSLAEVAKQRELSGTIEIETETMMKKQVSDAKSKELNGHDIFGPPLEISPRPLVAWSSEWNESMEIGEPALRSVHTSVKVSNPAGGQSTIMFGEEAVFKTAKKIHNQKFADLTGNDIFKGDSPPGSAEKPLSVAKLREMTGSDIFADVKTVSRDYLGGVRKPPGGESSIALV